MFPKSTILAAVLLVMTGLLQADEVSKKLKAEQMLELTGSAKMMKESFAQIQKMQASQLEKMELPAEAKPAAAEIQKRLMDMLAERLSWDRMRPTMVKLYMEIFTEDELNAIVSFYSTTAGQSMVAKMPQIMAKSMEMTMGLMSDVMPEIKRITEEVTAKYKAKEKP